jgi:anti-sigma B factor antagonist
MTAFTITPSIDRGHFLLTVSGELDLATVHRLTEHAINQLLNPAVPALVLDFARVSFTDATGLGALVRIRNVARHIGKQLVLVHTPPCVQRLLDVTGLDAVFEQQLGDTDHGIDTFLTPPLRDPLAGSLTATPSIAQVGITFIAA